MSTFMIPDRTRKWWWPIFHFCVDLCPNNAFQINRHQKENPSQKLPGLVGFRCRSVDTYYRRCRKTTQVAMLPGLRRKTKVSDKFRSDKLSHWISKVKLQPYAECGKITPYFCDKFNVTLHHEQ